MPHSLCFDLTTSEASPKTKGKTARINVLAATTDVLTHSVTPYERA